jgi:hypothetical protein
MNTDPTTIDPRATALLAGMPIFNSMGLLYAFQALALPAGVVLTAGFTRARAAGMVNEFLGYDLLNARTSPPSCTSLEGYVSWALDVLDTLVGRVEVVPA